MFDRSGQSGMFLLLRNASKAPQEGKAPQAVFEVGGEKSLGTRCSNPSTVHRMSTYTTQFTISTWRTNRRSCEFQEYLQEKWNQQLIKWQRLTSATKFQLGAIGHLWRNSTIRFKLEALMVLTRRPTIELLCVPCWQSVSLAVDQEKKYSDPIRTGVSKPFLRTFNSLAFDMPQRRPYILTTLFLLFHITVTFSLITYVYAVSIKKIVLQL